MISTRKFCTIILMILGVSLMAVAMTESVPMPSHSGYYNEIEEQPEDVLMELIARFGQTIMRARDDLENSKRTVDFGLARGFSGIQEAKHRMGLAAANYAGGPGRKRRSEATPMAPPDSEA
ncbi:diuretic hormone class 2 isoform X3 [Lutzomyia longipalpis]|uniref:diuretic hormone class 2 isoform X3 n=1 Tax=Lutzomyia longipalpis TaxID=7200 RepID=UPI00248343B9|nr:diuretic hormone class 2 isoform X3 [Lutzomyia longipalpis]